MAIGFERPESQSPVLARLRSATLGNFGDCDAVAEMRVHVGQGYRVYFVRRGTNVYVLLIGGDKSSQKRDIARAKEMARELREIEP